MGEITIRQAHVLRFSPDGKLAATSHEDNAVRLWYASDGSPAAVLKGASGETNDGAFSNDSHFFAAASADGTVRLWRLRWEDDKLAPVSEPNVLHEKQETPDSIEPKAVVFGPESDFVATAGEDFLQIWDPANGGELAALELEAPASAIVMSADGRRFATIHLDHVTLWKVAGSNFTGWRLQEEREQIDRADRGPIIESSATGLGFTWTDQSGWEPPVALTRDARTAAVVTGRRVVLVNGQTGRVISTIAFRSRWCGLILSLIARLLSAGGGADSSDVLAQQSRQQPYCFPFGFCRQHLPRRALLGRMK